MLEEIFNPKDCGKERNKKIKRHRYAIHRLIEIDKFYNKRDIKNLETKVAVEGRVNGKDGSISGEYLVYLMLDYIYARPAFEKRYFKINVKDGMRSYNNYLGKYHHFSKQHGAEIFWWRNLTKKYEKSKYSKINKFIINANQRLVHHIAKKYSSNSLEFLDLIQEGNLGMMEALRKFKVEIGATLGTYAHYWIRQHIGRALQDKDSTIRLPAHIYAQVKRYGAVYIKLVAKGERPTTRKLSRLLSLPSKQIKKIESYYDQYISSILSLNKKVGEDKEQELSEFIQNKDYEIMQKRFEQLDYRRIIEKITGSLSKKEKKVLRLRFGLDDGMAKSLQSIGNVLGVSRERIRQIEAKAKGKIKKVLIWHPNFERDLEQSI